MHIDSIEIQGFRNYRDSGTSFSPGINVIAGRNAQGKTNLLEAIYVLSTGRSFRTRSDRDLMGFDESETRLSASGEVDGREHRLEITLRRGRRREMSINGVKKKTAQEFAGVFSAVLFCPDDLELIRGPAALRRRLMDESISQLRPHYAAVLGEFAKAYEGKTRILRDWEEKPSLLPLLDDYNAALCRLGAELVHYRALFLKRLAPESRRIHAQFSGGEDLRLRYTTVSTVTDPMAPVADIMSQLTEHQRTHREAELASRLCLSGVHKDDIEVMIDGSPAKNFASQGQTRTAALSVKLAELEIHKSSRGEYPLLLLDDVLSELDAYRQDFVLNRVAGGQVFITCCEDEKVAKRTGGRVLTVENGRII